MEKSKHKDHDRVHQELSFDSDGVTLRGWLAYPTSNDGANESPAPLIILSHGLSGIVALDLAQYAQVFCAAGFACMAYDHRNWGESAGWPRCETDPWRQVADMREAISFARTLPGIDPERIGLWGTSYAGGHVITVSALDKRVNCVVSQVPLISGSKTFNAWVPQGKQAGFLSRLDADRDARRRGQRAKVTQAAIAGSETAQWIEAKDSDSQYVNELTVRSFDLLRSYEPVSFIENVTPTPLMMIVANHDTQTPTDWQLEAFEKAHEPKRLVRFDCRHYDVYMNELDEAAQAALSWYQEHL